MDESNPDDIGAAWTPSGYFVTGRGTTSYADISDNLIKRLQRSIPPQEGGGGGSFDYIFALQKEAAAALAEAQAEIARLKALLGRYAKNVAAREGIDTLEYLLPYGYQPGPSLEGNPHEPTLTEAEAMEIRGLMYQAHQA